jgi:hypothetical protein
MEDIRSIILRETKRYNEISEKRPLDKEELVNLEKLAGTWNKIAGKDLEPEEEINLSADEALAIYEQITENEIENGDLP